MNKSLIIKNENTFIYYIQDEKIPFYISIPLNINSDVSIAIDLLDNPNILNSNQTNSEIINNKLNQIYLNYKETATVIPLLDSNLMEQIKLNNNEKIFTYTDKIISYLINQAYSFLTGENIKVNNTIKLYNNRKYQVFNDWFIKKYNGRVELTDYNNQTNNNMNNVIAPHPEEKAAQNLANEVLENTNTINTINEEGVTQEKNTHELGFVSYVLLGVVVAVISLVILYMLL